MIVWALIRTKLTSFRQTDAGGEYASHSVPKLARDLYRGKEATFMYACALQLEQAKKCTQVREVC